MLYLKTLVLFVLLPIIFMVPMVNGQDVLIIANSSVPIDALSSSETKNIFLGRKSNWENESKITFFTTKQKATHKAFLKNYVGKSPTKYKTFWKKQVFSGKGKKPKSAHTDQEMVNIVTSTDGSIGYVSAGTDIGSAKTLSIK